jgi:hypothetical protein
MKIDREAYLINVRFNLHEALAIHLAARLLATRMERQNPHAAAAVRKLGIALERLAPQISYYLCESANQLDDPDPGRIHNIWEFWNHDACLGRKSKSSSLAS